MIRSTSRICATVTVGMTLTSSSLTGSLSSHAYTRSLVPNPVRGNDGNRRAWLARRARRVYRTGLLRRSRGRCVGLPEPELVPVRVLTGREPAHGRDRHRLACLPAEFLYPHRTCLDVVYREVRPHAVLARLHVGDRRALLPANLRRVVLERAGVRLELPAKQGAPELLAPGGVVRRDLDVHDLTWHRCLLVSSLTALPPSVPASPGGLTSSATAEHRVVWLFSHTLSDCTSAGTRPSRCQVSRSEAPRSVGAGNAGAAARPPAAMAQPGPDDLHQTSHCGPVTAAAPLPDPRWQPKLTHPASLTSSPGAWPRLRGSKRSTAGQAGPRPRLLHQPDTSALPSPRQPKRTGPANLLGKVIRCLLSPSEAVCRARAFLSHS